MSVFDDIVEKPNAGDRVRLTGGLISYEVLDPIFDGTCGGSPDERVVGVCRTELFKPEGINGTFQARVWQGQVPVAVWSDIVRRCSTVERAHVAASEPKLSG